MTVDYTNWSYHEFLAFLMIYAAEMNAELSTEELHYIQSKTQVDDISRIKRTVENVSDVEALEVIEEYRKIYLHTPEQEQKVRQDLEDLLKNQNKTTQFENAVVHILERII